MEAVTLNEKQEHLKAIIESNLTEVKNWNGLNDDIRKEKFNLMAKAAHELHMSINPHPKHHRYMIENRGMKPEDPDFYRHIHPVEDLLSYLINTNANDDPQDQTINIKFTLSIYSRRWGHKDTYDIIRIEDGWSIRFGTRSGNCNKEGKPVLFDIMDNDLINYPQSLPEYLEWVWNRAEDQGLTEQEVQGSLDELSEWISVCETNSPNGIFREYK